MAGGGGAFAYLNLDAYLVMYNVNHYFINDLSISNKNKNITYLHY